MYQADDSNGTVPPGLCHCCHLQVLEATVWDTWPCCWEVSPQRVALSCPLMDPEHPLPTNTPFYVLAARYLSRVWMDGLVAASCHRACSSQEWSCSPACGKILLSRTKMALANEDNYWEPNWFTPWSSSWWVLAWHAESWFVTVPCVFMEHISMFGLCRLSGRHWRIWGKFPALLYLCDWFDAAD